MRPELVRLTVSAFWVLAICAVVFSTTGPAGFGWLGVAALVFFPPFVLWRLWRVPAQTTSEAIRDSMTSARSDVPRS